MKPDVDNKRHYQDITLHVLIKLNKYLYQIIISSLTNLDFLDLLVLVNSHPL